MLKINQTTTFDEVHQWISNYFNSTYARADEEKGTIGAINDPDEEQYEEWNEETEEYYDDYNDEDVKFVVAMLNKGKGKRRQKGGKSKGKERTIKELHAMLVANRATFHPIAQTKEARKHRKDRDNGMMERAINSHNPM
eukprot:2873137-Amphidinium_carterae.1